MANIITAGNSTNGGTQIVTDTSGTLNIVTGSGSGVTAMSIDASGNVSGVLKSGTAVTNASGASIDFTGIPSTAKRITVMFSDVSLSGTATLMVRLGTASGIEAGTIYFSMGGAITTAGVASAFNYTTGFGLVSALATNAFAGQIIITNLTGNTWVMTGTGAGNTSNVLYFMGRVSLTGVLTQLRCTNNGSDTFDGGTINILYE